MRSPKPAPARTLGAAVALMLAAAGSAQAAPDAATLQLRSLAATCANCHGTDGRALPDTGMLPLAGREAGYIAEQMRAFRDGKRPATVMHQLAKGYTDAQIDAVAAYFAAQKAQ